MTATSKDMKYVRWVSLGAALFSTCGKAQYMAVVVDRFGTVVATGYNGGPAGWKHCNEGGCPRWQANTAQGGSYDDCIAIHAEQNALLRVNVNQCEGATLYVNGLPCLGCAKVIAGSGIKRVVFLSGRAPADLPVVYGFFERAGVTLVEVT